VACVLGGICALAMASALGAGARPLDRLPALLAAGKLPCLLRSWKYKLMGTWAVCRSD
jgi:hypothetical protein